MNTNDIVVPKLSLQEQVELGKRMSEGDVSARDALVLSCVPIAKAFIKTPLCLHLSTADDIFQDGMLGAAEAVDKYDYRKNVMFTTFAFYYVQKRIFRGVISSSPVKIHERDFYNSILLKSSVEAFTAVHHIPPTDEQLSNLTGIPLNTVKLLQTRNFENMVVSINDPLVSGHFLALPEEDVCFVVERILKESAQKQLIAEALTRLTPPEREIVFRRIMCKPPKMTLKQLAEIQNVHIATVAKREKTAVKKLLAYFIEHDIGFEDIVC